MPPFEQNKARFAKIYKTVTNSSETLAEAAKQGSIDPLLLAYYDKFSNEFKNE